VARPALNNISLDEIIDMISSEVNHFLERFGLINTLVPLVVLILTVIYLARAFYGHRKKHILNGVFQFYCGALIVLTGVSALVSEFGSEGALAYLPVLGYAAFLSLPALFFLHTWTQVSYKKIKALTLIGCFVVPFILTVAALRDVITNVHGMSPWDFLVFRPISFSIVLLIGYWIVMIVKSFLLCFNVLYQMPKHMRASTILLIAAVSASAADLILSAIWETKLEYLIFLILQYFIINRCFGGFFRANASNVIATSREFIFSNLSTQILVLGLKGRILEWNKTGGSIFSFLRPKYLQSYDNYLEQLLTAGNGVISPHQDNIITVTFDGVEYHLLITSTPIKEGDRQFGSLIEISEVTNIYSVLRYMETIATIDQMTGLRNKNAYLTEAGNLMNEAAMPLLIIIGDVNNLKQVNDVAGHLAGDRMLSIISTIIAMSAPEKAFVARIGGDEIILLVPNAAGQIAAAFAENVSENLSKVTDAEFGTPSISWGWAVVTSPDEDYNAAFKAADAQMYLRKKVYKDAHPFTLSGTLPESETE